MKLAGALVALALVSLAGLAPALAAGTVGALSEAQARLNAGDYYQARELTDPLLEDESVARGDRAEALRLNGLARFFLGDREGAEAALLEFLELEPEAHLDPALVPPVGIAFFEDVRARHAAEIARFVKKPKRRGYAVVNLLTPFGQFQNGEHAKAWALGATELLLASTAVTTYVWLRQHCDQKDDTCDPDDTARTMLTVNHTSFGLLVGVWLYGAIDGYLGWRRREAELGGSETVVGRRGGGSGALVFTPADGGGSLVWAGTF
jgi:hypothetical protein